MPPNRDEAFVPLTSTAAPTDQRADQRVTILPQAANAQPFRPLTAGAAAHATCEPRVTVQRDGDRVSLIQIQCGCGQLIEVACVYDQAGAKPA